MCVCARFGHRLPDDDGDNEEDVKPKLEASSAASETKAAAPKRSSGKAKSAPSSSHATEDGVSKKRKARMALADDVKAIPFGVGEALLARARDVSSARAVDTRVTQDGQSEEAFVQPLIVPRAPERYYFKFGKPIRTEEIFAQTTTTRKKRDAKNATRDEDLEAAETRLALETYAECRASVEDGIDWLLARRSEDPFKDTPGRVIWEAAAGKQAPTFTP